MPLSARLLGADDVLRRLSLLTVRPVMLPPAPLPGDCPPWRPPMTCAMRWCCCCGRGADVLPVRDADGSAGRTSYR